MTPITRRKALTQSTRLLGGATLGLPLAAPLQAEESPGSHRKLKIVAVGGHPDDPQSGCGGVMALYADHGHDVVALFLTRGELGIRGKAPQETAEIRSREAGKSCNILKARTIFASQIDAATEVNAPRYAEFQKLLDAEQPDLVFTHWPIDSHRDHRAASLLVFDAWLKREKRFELYYYEVELGSQTQNFWPTHYVDIGAVLERKRAACFAHASTVNEWWPLHEAMHRFRGMECGCKAAEAYVRHVPSGSSAPHL